MIGRQGAAIIGIGALIDLPLSIVGDTLTLPYTTWAVLTGHTECEDPVMDAYRKWKDQEQRKGGQESPGRSSDGPQESR
jgi:hypothetical protein